MWERKQGHYAWECYKRQIQEGRINPCGNQGEQGQVNAIQAKPINYAQAEQGSLEGSKPFTQIYAYTQDDVAMGPYRNITN